VGQEAQLGGHNGRAEAVRGHSVGVLVAGKDLDKDKKVVLKCFF